ncbi:alpha-hydroxy-acid oxidizing protein [Lysinibacillus sp. M3]|uniref:Alpha-hydroxy-acid oxidizing protein n=1 Tax=Lysinibacillus zambalensis TaxID=3160866 RepID=A0ABV1MLR0_9BACI
MALGAKAVLVGRRPCMYGLALVDEEGVKQVLRNLIADFIIKPYQHPCVATSTSHRGNV